MTSPTHRPDAGFVASVVIPCYNVARTITEQLEALSEQPLASRLQVIVSDNRSDDGTAEVVRSRDWGFGELLVVEASDSQTIAHARNVGITVARSPAVLVCDGDDRVQENWVEAMLEALVDHDLVVGTLIPWDPVSGAVVPPDGAAESALPRWYGFLPSGVGASLAFRRHTWDAVGGFDESLSIGAEDTDFCWRVQLAGFTIGAAPNATILYRLPPTMSMRYRKRFRDARSQVTLYVRYRDLGMPPVSSAKFVRRWASIVWRVTKIAHREQRLQWWGDVGHACGRLTGSVRERVWYP